MKNLTFPVEKENETASDEPQASDPRPFPQLGVLSREKAVTDPRIAEHVLPSGRRVEVALDQETVRIYSTEGRVELLVSCTAAGCVLQFETANLSLRNQGKIDLRCEELCVETAKQLSLHSQGHISAKVQGDFTTNVAGALKTRADEIHMKATSGDAVVEANDLVRVKGEQILLNSEDNPREHQRQLDELWKKLCP
jgi:hypothetical protein